MKRAALVMLAKPEIDMSNERVRYLSLIVFLIISSFCVPPSQLPSAEELRRGTVDRAHPLQPGTTASCPGLPVNKPFLLMHHTLIINVRLHLRSAEDWQHHLYRQIS